MCPSEAEICVVVLATAPDSEVGARLARMLVESSLAACVNLVPGVSSVYRWEGEVCEQTEVLLIAKAPEGRVAALTEWLIEAHPYSVPEVITLTITGGNMDYLKWIREECGT